MKLSDFDYQLPKELIAQYPLKRRDNCRLLVIEKNSQKIYQDKFYNILKYLPKDSCLILNDSRVIPARLLGRREKTGGRVEVLLLNQVDGNNTFNALINPLKKIKIDQRIIFNGSKIYCQLIDAKQKIVRFNCDILKHLKTIGQIPLPPYIKRVAENLDKEYYQTVYAKCNGSIASPTAGLHFTNELLSKIKETQIKIASLTLHVNYATFNPVKEEDITRHKMYCEEFRVSRRTVKIIQQAKESNRKIVAVGTTSCRVLETISNMRALKNPFNALIPSESEGSKVNSLYNFKILHFVQDETVEKVNGLNIEVDKFDTFGDPAKCGVALSVNTEYTKNNSRKSQQIVRTNGVYECVDNHIYQGSTNLFIYPGYKFKLTDGIITNFHFPKTTLFMLVCALAGRDLIMKAYQEAIAKKYRFYSYGDAMLII